MDATIDKDAERVEALRALLEIHDAQTLINRIIRRVPLMKADGLSLKDMIEVCLGDDPNRIVTDQIFLIGVILGAAGEVNFL